MKPTSQSICCAKAPARQDTSPKPSRGGAPTFKTVKVTVSLDIEIEVPNHWNKEKIEFHWNESSSCLSNILPEITKFEERIDCFCGHGHVTFIGEADGRSRLEE